MSAEHNGAKLGDKLDSASNSSYHEIGAKAGNKFDGVRSYVNENYKSTKGKTPEDYLKELYGGSVDLAVHSYNYAWSWVPFTQQKAKEAKQKIEQEDLDDLKSDLKSKGFEIKESAKDKEEETKQTIYELVDEARSLAGKFLDTAIDYVSISEQKVDEAAKNAQSKVDSKSSGYIERARGLAAQVLQKSKSVVTYGQQKAKEAADAAQDGAAQAKEGAENVKDDVKADANANGGAPHFELNVRV